LTPAPQSNARIFSLEERWIRNSRRDKRATIFYVFSHRTDNNPMCGWRMPVAWELKHPAAQAAGKGRVQGSRRSCHLDAWTGSSLHEQISYCVLERNICTNDHIQRLIFFNFSMKLGYRSCPTS
jgi:hypothetical protein